MAKKSAKKKGIVYDWRQKSTPKGGEPRSFRSYEMGLKEALLQEIERRGQQEFLNQGSQSLTEPSTVGTNPMVIKKGNRYVLHPRPQTWKEMKEFPGKLLETMKDPDSTQVGETESLPKTLTEASHGIQFKTRKESLKQGK